MDMQMQERKICFGDFANVEPDHHDHNDLTSLREELEGTRNRLSRLLRAKNEEGPTLLIERDTLLFECGHLKLEVEALQEQISQLAAGNSAWQHWGWEASRQHDLHIQQLQDCEALLSERDAQLLKTQDELEQRDAELLDCKSRLEEESWELTEAKADNQCCRQALYKCQAKAVVSAKTIKKQSEDLLSSQHANGILRFRLDRMRDNRDDLQNEVATLKEDLQYKRRQYSIVTRAYYKKWVQLRKSSRQNRILRRRCSRLQRSVIELRQAAQVQPAAPLQEQATQAAPVQEEPAQPAAEQQEEAFLPVPTEASQAAAGLEESSQPARLSAGQVDLASLLPSTLDESSPAQLPRDLACPLPSTLDESSPAQLPRDLACPLPSTLDESSPAQPPRDLACPLPSNLSLSAASLGQSAAAAPLHISAGAYHGSPTGPESFPTSEEDDDLEALQLLGENGQLKNFLHEANQQQELQAATIQALVCERERLRAEVNLSQDAVACAKQLPIIPLAVQESIQWKHVAEGGFGNVCVGSLRVAAKVPRFNTSEYQASVDTEASTLMSLSHPNIVRPLAMMECRTGQRAMLMEFFERGTLQENFRSALTGGTLPLQEQLQIMLQAIDGLIHAHSREVFNCDLKLENIFVRPDGSVAVGDFGLAVHGAQTPPGLRGTTGFVPPEAIRQQVTGRRYDEHGVVAMACSLLTGECVTDVLTAQYKALGLEDLLRVDEVLFAAGRDLNSTFLRVGMAQYMGLIPGVVHVVSPRQLPPCADQYVRYITSAMQLIRDPASRSEFSLDLTRRVMQSCLDDLVEQGLESLEECAFRQLLAQF